MDKIIIAIHGLANKPPKEIISPWWKTSILEGLEKNCHIQNPNFHFNLVFWADLLYKHPRHNDSHFSFDRQYNHEPYVPAKPGALKKYKDSIWDELQREGLDIFGDTIDFFYFNFSFDNITSLSIDRIEFLRDLRFYYENKQKILNRQGELELVRKVIRNEVKQTLLAHQDKEIMIIGHSMGSIIAYDCLRDLGQEKPSLEVPYFVTIGSPLGLPYVKKQIIKERDYSPEVRTPTIVTKSWVNFADKRDLIAADAHLSDDYSANKNRIYVKDNLVANDYEKPDGSGFNYHKSYGYLRTPELSEHLKLFLAT
jgi:hypothetical protein